MMTGSGGGLWDAVQSGGQQAGTALRQSGGSYMPAGEASRSRVGIRSRGVEIVLKICNKRASPAPISAMVIVTQQQLPLSFHLEKWYSSPLSTDIGAEDTQE